MPATYRELSMFLIDHIEGLREGVLVGFVLAIVKGAFKKASCL
jgi:hypothetical protein